MIYFQLQKRIIFILRVPYIFHQSSKIFTTLFSTLVVIISDYEVRKVSRTYALKCVYTFLRKDLLSFSCNYLFEEQAVSYNIFVAIKFIKKIINI